jgi:hypothetical protein
MVSYCPLDIEEDQPERLPPKRVPPPKPQVSAARREETECNFVVMFFIVGSIALALSDSVK